MNFSIDAEILAGYRRRADIARAACRENADSLRDAKSQRGALISRGMTHVKNRVGGSNDPIEALHDSERVRLSALDAEIARLMRDNASADHEAAYSNSIGNRLAEFAGVDS